MLQRIASDKTRPDWKKFRRVVADVKIGRQRLTLTRPDALLLKTLMAEQGKPLSGRKLATTLRKKLGMKWERPASSMGFVYSRLTYSLKPQLENHSLGTIEADQKGYRFIPWRSRW